MSSPQRRGRSQTTLSSKIPQGPRISPPKSPTKTASPIRKPLHERSNSDTNQYTGPTIRLVQDASDDIYQKYPVPSEPSQILPPPRHAPGYGFERPGSRVSGGSQVASTIAKFEASRTQASQEPVIPRKKGLRHSASTRVSDADTLVASSFSPSSVRFSQGSTAPSSPAPEFEDYEKNLEVLEEEAPVQKTTIRAVPPSSSGGDSLESRTRALTPKPSAASFASPNQSDPATPSYNAGNASSVTVSRPLPEPPSEPEEGRPSRASDLDNRQPVLNPQQSKESITFSDISYTSIEPTHTQQASSQPSPTLHEASTASFASGIRIHYPVVRAPSSNSLRADSQGSLDLASRMQDRSSLVHHWSSALSTIPSVSERDSQSTTRNSRSWRARSLSQESSVGLGRTSMPRRRGQTIGSANWSNDNESSDGLEPSAVPRPLFSPGSRASSEERDYQAEHLDTISPLPTTVPLRKKASGYLQRSNSSDALSVSDSRPNSSHSNVSTFFSNSIPGWARVYYQRGERISYGAPESESSCSIRPDTSHSGRSRTPSESNFPISIYRPRNRPRHRGSDANTISLADDIQYIEGEVYTTGPQMPPLSTYSTPHLRTDRRSNLRYSMWNAPSLDDDIHVTLFGRQNRQILLFCLGFIFPLSWIIASFLPLPPDPKIAFTPTASQAQLDVEQQFAQHFGPVDDKAFQKATWWRNLNRVMSGVGTLLIGIIIALAILASRMA